MYLLNGKEININATFVIDGITYANLTDSAIREQLGIIEVADPVYPDQRFYYAVKNEDGSLAISPKSLDQVKQVISQEIANDRYQKEINGVVLPSGEKIATDRESQSKVSGALLFVQRNPNALIDWKGVNGWVQLNKEQIEAIADAVAMHVQSCFSEERIALAELEAMTDVEAVINKFSKSG